MQKLIVASVLAGTLAAPAAFATSAGQASSQGTAAQGTASQTATSPGGGAQTGSRQATRSSPWITVTSADNLVGRALRDTQGKDAGRIRAVVVDLDKGTAVYALVGSQGSFDVGNTYVPVPFSALRLSPGDDAMTVSATADKLAKAPRMDENQLTDLNQPSRMGTVYGHYATTLPHGYVMPPSSDRAEHPHRYILVRPDQMTPLVTNRDTASSIRGETVKAQNGESVGEIDRIMLDPSSGRIAYLLLSRGGFLGIGEEWVPVPAQALSWSDRDGAYVMKAGADKLRQRGALQKGDVPTQVRREQLQSLYEAFGVTPYWQDAA